ncbi:fungal-specific transcription factor domain-containing protein [Cryomyces antarcticus]
METHTLAQPDQTNNKGVRRACDCCRKRKVRCDSYEPCGPCKKASLRCAYLQTPKKKGPKGLRSARVLHALRKIDEACPPKVAHPKGLSQWTWMSNEAVPTSSPHPGDTPIPPDYGVFDGEPFEVCGPGQYSGVVAETPVSAMYGPRRQDAMHSDYSSQADSLSPTEYPVFSPVSPETMWARLPSKMFLPYVTLFFTHLYPIMPIIDRKVYLNPELYTKYSCLTSENYAFLSALSAATIVQLDVAAQLTQDSNVLQADCGPPGELYISECLRERQRYDYIENPTTLTVMTSFFIFCYYGNLERHEKAWHFLQESISFAQVLNLDDEHAILELDPTEAQWRRRLYWLLFITERAYAIQRRKHTRLHPSIQLPLVFSSEDAQLLNGFVNLVHLFSAVNDDFVKVWRGQRKKSLCSEPWLAGTQHALDATAFALQDVTETQQLDIEVSREWLHVLAWQMGVSNGLLWSPHDEFMRLDYPVGLAKKVVKITQGANPVALDSHGIGMVRLVSRCRARAVLP